MSFYDSNEYDESLLLSLASGIYSLESELARVNCNELNRYFILTTGDAFTGNMGSSLHKDMSIAGKPINLANRIDELTKNENFLRHMSGEVPLILSSEYGEAILRLVEVDLEKINLVNDLEVRTYTEEKYLYFLFLTDSNLSLLKHFFSINKIGAYSYG
jgi:hypothetical protein